jgi:hypothetical protein
MYYVQDYRDLINLESTCKTFRNAIIYNNALWFQFYKKTLGILTKDGIYISDDDYLEFEDVEDESEDTNEHLEEEHYDSESSSSSDNPTQDWNM